MGRTTLMCSSPNLIEALDEPTLFCIISGNDITIHVILIDVFLFIFLKGAIFHYVYLGLIVWWFLHLCVFFYEVMFPFHANQMRKMGKVKKASIVLTVIGLVNAGFRNSEHSLLILYIYRDTCSPSWRYRGFSFKGGKV